MSDLEAGPHDLPESVDVVVIGAGHNGLVCAGYLAAAGLEVLVLEASPGPGGNTRTEELTLPGFAHDSCSSAHVLIQSNPLIRDDELGLLSEFGLEYLRTDPAVVMPQPDGRALVMHPDLDATVGEVARWSTRDAQQFRAMMDEWYGGLAAVHARWSSGLDLGESEDVRRYLELRSRSAWDVVHERFEDATIRSFVLWLAMATIQDPRRPGTGFLPSSLSAGRLRYGWCTPVGGSAALPDALVRCVTARQGRVVCSAPVARIEVTGGRVGAVRTQDGRRVRVRQAVVSSAHLALLGGMLEGAGVPADLKEAEATWRPGLSVFAVHAALRADIGFRSKSGPVSSVAGGMGSAAGMAAQIDAFHRGEPDAVDPWLLIVDQTVVDPQRAPDGAATLKLLTVAPYERADGRSWEDTKQAYAESLMSLVARRAHGLEEEDILALRAESPVDVAAHNPHNLGGSCHGGEFVAGDNSVLAGWPSYRCSVPGLFLTGATTHPGGSVSGRSGRNAARTVLVDLGLDPLAVIGPS
jgi:phytoene dehydrogenase-like protein